MPHTYIRDFRIRLDECDANGHLFNANYARLMQDAAIAASADAGYDIERYNAIGHHWLVRQTTIQFLKPIRYNDHVSVKTWVADIQRTNSRRVYEFTANGDEKPAARPLSERELAERELAERALAARAHTDWVYINAASLRPAPVPEEMRQAFFPEGVPDSFPRREKFPAMPEKPVEVYSSQRRVEWKDVDNLGMVNNPCYLDYCAETGIQVIEHFGWSWERMAALGFAIFLRTLNIQYRQPARYGDTLEISTWASGVKKVSATRHYEIRKLEDRSLLANVHTEGVWVDLKSGRPIRIPHDLLADFSVNITGVNITDMNITDMNTTGVNNTEGKRTGLEEPASKRSSRV